MENMSETIPVQVTQDAGSSKVVDPDKSVETTADMSCIVTDQSRVENEEIDFEVGLLESFILFEGCIEDDTSFHFLLI